MTLLHFLGLACMLYLCAFVFLRWAARVHCDYCNKPLPKDDELFLGAHVCEECRERLFGM